MQPGALHLLGRLRRPLCGELLVGGKAGLGAREDQVGEVTRGVHSVGER